MKYPIQFCRITDTRKKPVWLGQMTLEDPCVDNPLIERVKRVGREVDPQNREVRAYNLRTKQYV